MAHGYLAPGEGEALWFAGQRITYKVRGRTGEATIFELAVGPHGGAPLHRHRTQDETHYILAGRYRFHCAGDTFAAERGAIVHVPKGVPHGFTNLASEAGTILCIATHPGPLEAFFDALGVPAADDLSPPLPVTAMDAVLAAARRTGGLEIVIPGQDAPGAGPPDPV
jgi:mannose-6-phosphate isomerase-like protein (cupin superfamily)